MIYIGFAIETYIEQQSEEMTQQSVKPGAPPCGLYYRISCDDDLSMPDIRRSINQIAMVVNRSSAYEKNMHVIEFLLTRFSEHDMRELVDLVQRHGFVALVRDDIALADHFSADGVVLNDIQSAKEARKILGDDSIVGLHCINNKSAAEDALTNHMDFVSFGTQGYGLPDLRVIEWWQEKTTKPCAALGNITDDSCIFLVKAGAGFVDVTNYIDHHKDGVMQAVSNIVHSIESVETVQ